MKVKTSVTLSEDILNAVEVASGDFKSRSALIEQALRSFFRNRLHQMREAKDLQILNGKAKALNEEAEDVLSYQVEL